MTNATRPRVAAIGLDDLELASIELLCGELRPSDSVDDYLERYNWTETDVLVTSSDLRDYDFTDSVNVMATAPVEVYWRSARNHTFTGFAVTDEENTERELAIPPDCPDLYRPLASELSKQLRNVPDPPNIVNTSRLHCTTLIQTTSGHPVALRLLVPAPSQDADNDVLGSVVLLLPRLSNLATWLRAFLSDLHEYDSTWVPQAPPRLSEPSDWYTPEERILAGRISQIDSDLQRLSDERDQLEAELAAEGERADGDKRRALWVDGEELVAAAQDILSELGFVVRDMDAELNEGEPKREDLRLTLPNVLAWEAIVEVKGYPGGTKTNDASQIRKHRDLYIKEEGQEPNLTVWLCNPHRRVEEPSSRPSPGTNVREAAEMVGAVHVLASDLYRQWALVASGCLEGAAVVQSLVNATPGLWTPPGPTTDT